MGRTVIEEVNESVSSAAHYWPVMAVIRLRTLELMKVSVAW
jgi:hypothetical protein